MTPVPVIIKGMRGLGDNIFQRPFVRVLSQRRVVYLHTPWPELYLDLGIAFLRENTPLRTQAKNITKQPPTRWAPPPPGRVDVLTIGYGSKTLMTMSMVQAMQDCFRIAPDKFDLPAFPRYHSEKPIAVIRPATERKEWFNSARGPYPGYIAEISDTLMKDYHVISVADLKEGEEWLVDKVLPPAHTRLHAGELGVRELLGLIQSARLVVGGVGWIVPACIASGVPLFCLLGGCGEHNAPEKITDPRMDLSHVGFATPDHLCRCGRMRHDCNKTISNLDSQWAAWRKRENI